MGDEKERERKREKWLSSPSMIKWYRDGDITFKKPIKLTENLDEGVNNVYIYKTIRYPPNSTPPTSN